MKILSTAIMYAVLVILISYALAFPGFGVLILPQPFLDVYVGRWTMGYVINSKIILWIGYVIFIHFVYYSFVKPTIRTIILGGILFFIISVILALFTSVADPDLRIRLTNYLVGGVLSHLLDGGCCRKFLCGVGSMVAKNKKEKVL